MAMRLLLSPLERRGRRAPQRPAARNPVRRKLIRMTQAQVIANIEAILHEAGTSWDYVMKTTVYLANMSDYSAMNEVYGKLLPSPKPARTAVEVGKLPGNFLIEMEAIAAIPDVAP